MELAEIRRIAVDVISDYGPRCELIDVKQAGDRWLAAVRRQSGAVTVRYLEPDRPAALRSAIKAWLDSE